MSRPALSKGSRCTWCLTLVPPRADGTYFCPACNLEWSYGEPPPDVLPGSEGIELKRPLLESWVKTSRKTASGFLDDLGIDIRDDDRR